MELESSKSWPRRVHTAAEVPAAAPDAAPPFNVKRTTSSVPVGVKPNGVLPLMGAITFGVLFVCLLLYAVVGESHGESSSRVNASNTQYRGVLMVTLGWAALYYCFLFSQAASAHMVHSQLRHAARKQGEQEPSFFATKYLQTPKRGLIFFMDRAVGSERGV